MARRKSKAKQEEELIQGITGLIVFVCFFGTYGLTKSMTAAGIMTGVGIAGFIGVMVALALRKREKLRLSGIADIDQMDGVQFESYLGLFSGKARRGSYMGAPHSRSAGTWLRFKTE